MWDKDPLVAALLTGRQVYYRDDAGALPPAIAPGRGLPADASESVRDVAAALSDVTWVLGSEVLSYPLWDEPLADRAPRGLGIREYAMGMRHGFDARIGYVRYYAGASAVSCGEMERYIDGLGGADAVVATLHRGVYGRSAAEALAERWRRAHPERPELFEVYAPPPRWDSRIRFECAGFLHWVEELVRQSGASAEDVRITACIG
jgi:hypothetical protein